MKPLWGLTLCLAAALISGWCVGAETGGAPASALSLVPAGLPVYFGTYTGARSKGIYLSILDPATGALAPPVLAAEIANPSFLALHPGGRFVYAVSEIGGFQGKPGGAVTAFVREPETGVLRPLNQVSTLGDGPCHLVVDPAGRNVLAANYGGGSVVVIALEPEGRLGAHGSFLQHQGSSVNPQRQKGPHAHGVYLDAASRFAFVPDLGLDRVMIYRFDSAAHSLAPMDPPAGAGVKPGAGPRHFAFHPNGRFGYVINELDSTITALGYDATRGRLTEFQTVPTLPADFTGRSTTAEIAVHPGGRFLYGSNRGHDSIAVFALDPGTGKLTFVQHEPTRGRTPRSFAIDPTGTFLLAANQDSDSVAVFRIDAGTGRLTPTGRSLDVGAPVCVMFASRAR
jgi:6-phosphogluconolactonase